MRYTTPSVDLAMDPDGLAVLELKVRDSSKGDPLVDTERLGAMVTLHRSFARSMPEYPLVEAEAGWLL